MGRTIVLDTDVLIEIFERKNEKVIEKIERLVNRGYILGTTTINVSEWVWGAKTRKDLENMIEVIETLEIFPLEKKSSILSGIMHFELSKKGQKPSFRDCLIASICITNGLMLYTLNKKDFKRFERFGLFLIQ